MALRKRVFVLLPVLVVALAFVALAPAAGSALANTEASEVLAIPDEDSENNNDTEILMWWIVLAVSAVGILFSAIWYSVRRRKVRIQRNKL